LFVTIPRPTRSTLFPYTTLFRSTARVGNESLAVPLYTAVIWLALRRKNVWVLGAALGLGLLTKAYFLAAVAGVALVFFAPRALRSEEHTSELQSRGQLVCRLLL